VTKVTATLHDQLDGFGGLVVPEFAGSIPTEAVGFFFSDVKKSSACLPSEGK
jgi:hypothetical protein